jgi:hypothetical protein
LLELVLPAGAVLCAGQLEQVATAVAPTAAENLPASQTVQMVEAVPAAYVPAGQDVQLVEAVEPVNLPA